MFVVNRQDIDESTDRHAPSNKAKTYNGQTRNQGPFTEPRDHFEECLTGTQFSRHGPDSPGPDLALSAPAVLELLANAL